MPIPTIEWDRSKVKLIDQTKLPNEFVYIYCQDVKSLFKAIKSLQVRGAPALGIAGALGVVLGIQHSRANDYKGLEKELDKVIACLGRARPTAVNLFWALKRMKRKAKENSKKSTPQLKRILLDEALSIIEEDRMICRRIARVGSRLLKDRDTVLTHCNAGGLATADYGTALGVIYGAKSDGKKIKVYADETRPLLQGARLTTWELMKQGIDVTLICDNTAAFLMKQGKIDKVLVGADRIARNGDAANKIGTYNLAISAKFHKIPFYVVAPVSTFDLGLKNGEEIPIEERGRKEVIEGFGKRIAPKNAKVYSPAFDVTPHRLITAIVTEKGILKPPYRSAIKKIIRGT